MTDDVNPQPSEAQDQAANKPIEEDLYSLDLAPPLSAPHSQRLEIRPMPSAEPSPPPSAAAAEAPRAEVPVAPEPVEPKRPRVPPAPATDKPKKTAAARPPDASAPAAAKVQAPSTSGPSDSVDSPAQASPPEPPPEPEPPPAPKAPPQWKVLEPEDQTDPVQHEQYEAHLRAPDWSIVAASVRGKLHAHKGCWREDSYKFGWVDDWTILAVADGAGSARLSRIGSRIACDKAVETLETLLKGWRVGPGEQQPTDADLRRLRVFLSQAGEGGRLGVLREAQRRGAPPKDFYCTLLVVVHAPWQDKELVAVLQVGDGAVGLVDATGTRVIGIADHGEYSSETRFLVTPGIELEYENRVVFSVAKEVQAIGLMSDGVSDDFYPESKRIHEIFDGQPVPGIATKAGEPVLGLRHGVMNDARGGEALRDWLLYEKRGSSDDRTLLLMHRRPS